ncbi:hypothetical protein B0H67DRAFT_567435 [Lasiosphaeris hirsuta]|uniref:DUF1993 domain-containing protein n=1 Tax=Lasiosphaeris hirsuta TaxID=260670 RepID=A0AA40AYB7_9PEZI|nr:hypothetical protein B0H67DRAFT_567435 [Lasiosphaeris hirsuta]
MAPLTLYDSSIDLFVKAHEVLKHILKKAKNHAPEESASFPAARLYEDMRPLSFQVQNVTNYSVRCVERLLPHKKAPFPVWEEDEATLDQLFARIDESLAFLKSIEVKDLEGGLSEQVLDIKMGRSSVAIEGKGYALGIAVPNVFFHVSMAYAILRMKGVPLGKKDFSSPYVEPYVLSVSE